MKGKNGDMFKLCLSILIMFIMALPANRAYGQPLNYQRLFGSDRYETAVKISQKGWPDSSEYAVLARGDDFPDALCAGPLAKKYDAPILLTEPGSLNAAAAAELERLKAKNVFIAGGTGAVSSEVEKELISRGINVERLAGNDRYETSVKIAQKLGVSSKIALATGNDFPDALSISAVAAGEGMPILLTDRNSLPGSVKSYIRSKGVDKTYVIGGQGVISEMVFESVPNGKRISGGDRFETNVAVMREFADEINFNEVLLAVADGPRGDEFADALSGSVLAAQTKSPVVLVYRSLPLETGSFIKPRMTEDTMVTALGGEAVVPSSIIDDLLDIEKPSIYVRTVNPPVSIKPGETRYVEVDTNPKNAVLSASSSNPNVVSVSVSGNTLIVKGITQGTAVVNIKASKAGYSDGASSFVISPFIYNMVKNKYYNTIQEAVDDSSPGDTIKISSGTYKEHVTITKDNIKLVGAERDTTIIDATQDGTRTRAGIKISGVSGVEIKDLTVRNAGMNMTNGKTREPFGVYINNSDKNILDNIRFQGNGEYEVYLSDGCDLNIVQNCIIDGRGGKNGDYFSLDGIFSSGGEGGIGSVNTGNRFMNNRIDNVIYGISLTASEKTEILNNRIGASNSDYWTNTASAGVILSNSKQNIVQGNTIDGPQFGIRMSILSGNSPYAYAGTPDSNILKDNTISSLQHGIRVMGSSNTVENNSISGNSAGDGIWITDKAAGTSIQGNIIMNNGIGIVADNASNEIHFNKIAGGTAGIKNNTGTMINAVKNWWGEGNPKEVVGDNVDYSPWLGVGYDGNSLIPGFQLASPMAWGTDDSLMEVIELAQSGDSIVLSENTYTLSSQLVINKNLIISGASRTDTIIKIDYDTSNSGDSSGAILVGPGKTLSLSNLTIDGEGRKVMNAVRISGTGIINGVRIRNIGYDSKNGWGIYTCGSADVTVKNSTFSGIANSGVGVYGNAVVTVGGEDKSDGNSFNGDGEVGSVQYAVHVSRKGGNPQAVIKNNLFRSYASAGVYVESGTAIVEHNSFENSEEGIEILKGSLVNGGLITEDSAASSGMGIENSNTFSDDMKNKVMIYDSYRNKLLYPVPEVTVPVPSAPEPAPAPAPAPMRMQMQLQG